MAKARLYPPANKKQWWEDDYARTTMPGIDKLLLHTTESGKSWPSYSKGASAPTLTYNPWAAAGERWRQHNYLNTSARALRDSATTAVRENRDSVVQVEIVCYCDPKLAKQYGYFVGDLPAHAYEDLGALLAFLNKEWGVPIVAAGEWDTYPPSDSIRMSGPQYDRFKGMLGHQHASSNTHGDPGMTNAQINRIIAVAKRLTAPTTTPKPPTTDPGDDMALTDADIYKLLNFKLGTKTRAGTDITFGGALRAAAWLADESTEGGAIDLQLDGIDLQLDGIDLQLDRIEDDTDDGTAGKA